MTKTLQQLAQDAIDVQDACNLSGVVHAFGRAITDLREHISGTDAINSHPICQLWADKIAHLTGTQYDWQSTPAYMTVHDLAQGVTS